MLLASVLVAACAGGSPLDSRADVAGRVAHQAGLEPVRLRGGSFEIAGYRHYGKPGSPLTVYIEGDGLAWNAFGTAPSSDPTPRDPVALRLAAGDPAANRLYLARPCQYQSAAALARCSAAYWTSHRYAEEVVAAFAGIVGAEVRAARSAAVRLVGYSGGGALAALMAPRLGLPVELVTVAAPLDHAAWTRAMRISPMVGSLNPADIGGQLAAIAQTHFIAPHDEIVPASVARSYLAALGPAARQARLIEVPGTDHWCCWPDRWPALLGRLDW